MLDVICDVKDGKDVSKEELYFAVLSFNALEYSSYRQLERMTNAQSKEHIDFQVKMLPGFLDTRLKSLELPMDEYLGDGNIPGTQEYNDRRKIAYSVLKLATGIDLNDPSTPSSGEEGG